MRRSDGKAWDDRLLVFVLVVATSVSVLVVLLGFVFALAKAVSAQNRNHDLHHAQYETWQSIAGFNCCNNDDCGELPDKDVRERGGQYQVLVSGDPTFADEWCPVTLGHLVKAPPGKSPDWSRHHACILKPLSGRTPCERFMCFMGKVAL